MPVFPHRSVFLKVCLKQQQTKQNKPCTEKSHRFPHVIIRVEKKFKKREKHVRVHFTVLCPETAFK